MPQYRSALPTLTDGLTVAELCDVNGRKLTSAVLVDGSGVAPAVAQVAGNSGLSDVRNVLETRSFPHVWNGTTWDQFRKANANKRLPSSAATNNATSVKATPGDVFNITGFNATAGVKYLKLYNKASAPSPGSDNALLLGVFALPASAPFAFQLGPNGLYFSTGIAFALVTGSSDTDNTAVAAADILGLNILYF